jgi:hypothetical protein
MGGEDIMNDLTMEVKEAFRTLYVAVVCALTLGDIRPTAARQQLQEAVDRIDTLELEQKLERTRHE